MVCACVSTWPRIANACTAKTNEMQATTFLVQNGKVDEIRAWLRLILQRAGSKVYICTRRCYLGYQKLLARNPARKQDLHQRENPTISIQCAPKPTISVHFAPEQQFLGLDFAVTAAASAVLHRTPHNTRTKRTAKRTQPLATRGHNALERQALLRAGLRGVRRDCDPIDVVKLVLCDPCWEPAEFDL
eukprot:623596-Rhodomonas_salina.2